MECGENQCYHAHDAGYGQTGLPIFGVTSLVKNMEEGASYDNSGRSMRSTVKKMCGAV